ncbi:MAG TPA: DUF4833 domain-containing protein [Chitinophagaceae bacterium]|nr:DUF4833 domain-containing protein [Chitinophagaceae bacterium]
MVSAQNTDSFPVPAGNPNQLFFLQRTPNINTIVYELNYKNGALDSANPVHVFWIRYAEKAQKTELNYIQRNLAYGLRVKFLSTDNYELRFVADKDAVLYLKKAKDNKYYVYTTINNKQAILYSVYLEIAGGTFLVPNVDYAELKGFDPDNGVAVSERIKIKK